MSYILEALKKSDQERKRAPVPDLQTLHIPSQVEQSPSRWPYVVIVLLMITLAFVVGWLQPWKEKVNVQAVKNEQPVITQPVVTAPIIAPETTAPVVEEPKVAIVEVKPAPEPEVEKYKIAEVEQAIVNQARTEIIKPSLAIESVPHLEEMPQLVQQAIPDMSFAGHVYSSNAEQRSVIINGHSMGEGDVVIDGLHVEQITSKGIVFNYQGQLFRMEILQDWSFD